MENELVFEPDDHIYRRGNVIIPSVTQILGQIVDMSGIPKDNLDLARSRGKAVHRALEFYDQDDLSIRTLDPDLVPYLDAWILFRKETEFVPDVDMIEQKFMHSMGQFAGTIDRVGHMGMLGKHVLVDIKAVAKLSPVTALQTAAYQELVFENTKHDRLRRFAVRLCDNGRYEVQEYKDSDDYIVFLSLVNLRNWRAKHAA